MTIDWRGAAVPILPVADLQRSIAFYRGIGFDVTRSPDGPYAFVRAGGMELHLSETEAFDPFVHAGMAYLTVADVDAIRAGLAVEDAATLDRDRLRQRWERGEPLTRATAVRQEPWGMRECSLLDPDNNLLRIGSPVS